MVYEKYSVWIAIICMFVCMSTRLFVHECKLKCVCVYVCVSVHACVRSCVCAYVHASMCICTFMCSYMDLCA